MYSRENLKLEEKEMPQEDFDDEANKRFLEEVYSMIKVSVDSFLEGWCNVK